MRSRDIFIRAGKNLKQAKSRTILTALAIAVGATTITLAMAAGAGGRDYINQTSAQRGIGDYATISVMKHQDFNQEDTNAVPIYEDPTESVATSPDSITSKSDDQLNQIDIDTISQIDGVAGVYPTYRPVGKYIQLSGSEEKFIPPSYSAFETNFLDAESLLSGNLPNDLSNSAVITEDLVKAFDKSIEDIIGKNIDLTVESNTGEIRTFSFTVVGVGENTGYGHKITVPHGTLGEMHEFETSGTSGIFSATVLPDKTANVSDLTSKISAADFTAYSTEDTQKSTMQAVNIAQWGLVGFGLLALIAAIFGIVNTQYISVLERTQQIGLMKAVGISRRNIGRLFRYEAAWVGLLGGIGGVLIAYLVSLSSPFLKEMMGLADSDIKLFIFEPITILIIIASLVLIAVISGYFPARKASKLDPIEALRTE